MKGLTGLDLLWQSRHNISLSRGCHDRRIARSYSCWAFLLSVATVDIRP